MRQSSKVSLWGIHALTGGEKVPKPKVECVLSVDSGPHRRSWCPARAEVEAPEGVGELRGAEAVMLDAKGREHRPIPCDVWGDPWEQAPGRVGLVFLLPSLEPGESLDILVRLYEEPLEGRADVEVVERDHKFEVEVLGAPFFSYNFEPGQVRPFIWPLLGPEGKEMTRPPERPPEFPKGEWDHPHHKSVWVAHGDVNGVDFWSEEEGHGRCITVEAEGHGGNAAGWIISHNEWRDANDNLILLEHEVITIYATPEPCRLFDIRVHFKAPERSVVFGDTKEAGVISFRVNPKLEVRRGNGIITNSFGGVNEADCWGRRAHWCDYSGVLEGVRVGLSCFDHPRNPRHPTYWHVRDYGLMTANIFGVGDFEGEERRGEGELVLPRGKEIRFLYRVYVHAGLPHEADVAGKYIDFACPPKVRVKEVRVV